MLPYDFQQHQLVQDVVPVRQRGSGGRLATWIQSASENPSAQKGRRLVE